MKRMFVILLSVVVAAALLTGAALAAGASISASGKEAKEGDSLSIPVSISGNPGLLNGAVTASYDANALTLTAIEGGDVVNGAIVVANPKSGMFSFFNGNSPCTGDGILATFFFTVKDGASTTTITFTASDMSDGDEKDVAGSAASATITITAPVHEHTWGDWVVTTEATCAEEGVETRTCTECGETDTRPIPKLTTHTWGDWVVTTAATCTADGVKTRTCSVCGQTGTDIIPATGHKWDEGKVTTPATCTEAGVMTYTCQNDAEHTKPATIAALGHDWSEWTTAKEATITEDGIKTRTCARCGETETEIIPAEGYKFLEGMDSAWTQGSSEDLSFRVNGELAEFDHAEVDGIALAEESCTTAEGSTILKLKPTYLDTLSVGSHTLTAVYSDGGKVSTTFSVKAKDSAAQAAATPAQGGTAASQNGAKRSPQTGDETPVALWVGVFVLCSGTAVLIGRRKFQ